VWFRKEYFLGRLLGYDLNLLISSIHWLWVVSHNSLRINQVELWANFFRRGRLWLHIYSFEYLWKFIWLLTKGLCYNLGKNIIECHRVIFYLKTIVVLQALRIIDTVVHRALFWRWLSLALYPEVVLAAGYNDRIGGGALAALLLILQFLNGMQPRAHRLRRAIHVVIVINFDCWLIIRRVYKNVATLGRIQYLLEPSLRLGVVQDWVHSERALAIAANPLIVYVKYSDLIWGCGHSIVPDLGVLRIIDQCPEIIWVLVINLVTVNWDILILI
jgi:hypothetical protein